MRHLVGFSLLAGLSAGLFGCSLSTVGAMDPVQGGKCATPMQTATTHDGCTECTCNGSTWDCTGDLCSGTGGAPDVSSGGTSTGGTAGNMGSGGAATGGSSSTGTGGTGMGASGGSAGTCTPGDSKLADDGCNKCTCTMSGDWACTLLDCAGPACTPGQMMATGCQECLCDATGAWSCALRTDAGCTAQTCKPGETEMATDGCNTCTCGVDGSWACTQTDCSADCPPPVRFDPKTCTATGAVYAQDPNSGLCCAYSSSCAAPSSWILFATPGCMSGPLMCQEGMADCDADPTNGCETNLTTSVANCGRCGLVCMAPAGTAATCQMGSCSYGGGTTPTCLYQGVQHAAGDSFQARDGCNTCGCVVNTDGTTDIACTERACMCDPANEAYRQYVGQTPDACKTIDFACPDDTTMFTNECGCGCEQSDECPDAFACGVPDSPPPLGDPCDATLEAMCPYSSHAQ